MAAPNLIPKERLCAYERWELASFDAPDTHGPASPGTATQAEEMYRQARLDGYQAGLKEGRQQAGSEAERLIALAASFSSEIAELDQRVAQQLLDVALEAARRMLGSALEVRPQLMLPVIQEAIRSLPVLGEKHCLRLHPEDAALLRECAGEPPAVVSGWAIIEDAAIERGGCVVCTSHGEVDATLDARWRRIVGTLGRDDGWLGQGEDKGET